MPARGEQKGRRARTAIQIFVAAADRKIGLHFIQRDRYRARAVAEIPDRKRACIVCEVTAETVGRTGVEMEALTAVSVGLLTIYDMCKAVDRGIHFQNIRLLEKAGGKSGHWQAD